MATVDPNAIKIAMGFRALDASEMTAKDKASDMEFAEQRRELRKSIIKKEEDRVKDLNDRLEAGDVGGFWGLFTKEKGMQAEALRLGGDLKVHDQVVQDATAQREAMLEAMRTQDANLRNIMTSIDEFDSRSREGELS